MECTIIVFGAVATLKDWHWTSKDKQVEDLLNSMLGDFPGPEVPQPAITEAERVVAELGGEVVFEEYFNREEGRVY